MVEIFPSSKFKRSFKKMPIGIKKDFNEKIEIFKSHPFHPFLKTHKLNGALVLVGQWMKISKGKANPGILHF